MTAASKQNLVDLFNRFLQAFDGAPMGAGIGYRLAMLLNPLGEAINNITVVPAQPETTEAKDAGNQ